MAVHQQPAIQKLEMNSVGSRNADCSTCFQNVIVLQLKGTGSRTVESGDQDISIRGAGNYGNEPLIFPFSSLKELDSCVSAYSSAQKPSGQPT